MEDCPVAELRRESALSGFVTAGVRGVDHPHKAGVHLTEWTPSALAQINGAPDESALTTLMNADNAFTATAAIKTSIGEFLWNGPGRWLVVSQSHTPDNLIAELEQRLDASDSTVTDLSHARTVARVDGPKGVELLCKLCPLDIERMPVTASSTSLIGQLTVQIHRRTNTSFDMYVFRSFGVALFESLIDEAREFGIHIDV
ncbi:MAG: hypothetical protein CMO26_21975 [Thiotrichales bacterium]|nr:hypothetical protein [Thiotrichales bacterium]